MRPSKRKADQLRQIAIELNPIAHAEGSCLISFGQTKLLCTASFEDRTPPWMRGQGRGWVTAEYGMLPRSTHERMRREASTGKQSGRTQEIQRLIGRSLRSVTDLKALGECQLTLDCDVLQADGGTRTAAISGAWVALRLAVLRLIEEDYFKKDPMVGPVSAVSCGIFKDTAILDLDYEEDSNAQADANFAIGPEGGLIEVQMAGEERPISESEFGKLLQLAQKGCEEIQQAQLRAVEEAAG